MRDYYEVLGVPHTATPPQLRTAFRQTAVWAHPDLNPDDPTAPERFAETVEAYEVLRDTDQRYLYDRYFVTTYGTAGLAYMPPFGPSRPLPPGFPRRSFEHETDRYLKSVVSWSAGDVAAIIGLVIFVFVAFSIVLRTLLDFATVIDTNFDPGTLLDLPLVNSLLWLTQWLVTLGVTFTYLKLRGRKVNLRLLGYRRTALGHAILLVSGVLVGSFIVQAVYVQFVMPQQEEVTSMFGSSVVGFVLAMTIVAILTPFVEETFFRGIIHRGLEQRFGFVPGGLLSAAIFTLAHWSPTVYVPIFVLGFGFAVLVSRTESLWPSIVGHFLWNTLGVVAQFLGPGSGS